MKQYKVNTIFYSIQGEGSRVGTPQVFVRFSGCNLRCPFCDTNHAPFTLMTKEEILEKAKEVGGACRSVSFCGGEPTLQLDEELLLTFADWFKSIETNGLKKVPQGVDYIVCSPKTKIIEPDNIDELRYVVKDGDKLPQPCKTAKKYYLSPCFDGEEKNEANIKHCIQLVKDNPKWNLGMQWHKFIGVE